MVTPVWEGRKAGLWRWLRVSAAVAAALASAGPVRAQNTSLEINAAVQLNLVPPGARGLAMGGAFVALADDATAAYTNPAGLTTLTSPEVSFEARNTVFSTLFTDGGNTGVVSNLGIDTLAGVIEGTDESSVWNAPFLSVVYPMRRFAVGLYRHELVNLEAEFETQGIFLPDNFRAFPVRAAMDIRIVNYGLSAAGRFGDVSIGLGLSLYDFDASSTTRRYDFDFTLPDGEPGSFTGPPDFRDYNNQQLQSGSDRSIGFNAGAVWRISRRWTLGASFRKGPSFSMEARRESAPRFGPGTPIVLDATFRIPDIATAGVAFRPFDRLTLAVDLQGVFHSQRVEDFVVDSFISRPFPAVDPQAFLVDDAVELHFGLEYVLTLAQQPLVLRAGLWTDPDHRIRFEGDRFEGQGPFFSAVFRPGDDYLHYTFGLGWVPSSRFQFDAAADLSARVKTGTVSVVVRF